MPNSTKSVADLDREESDWLKSSSESMTSLLSRTSQLATQFAQGKFMCAGGKISIGASATGRFQLANPSGSGKTITLYTANFVASTQDAEVQFLLDGVLGTSTTLTNFKPNRAYESVPSVGVAKTSIVAPTQAGTAISPLLFLRTGVLFELKDFNVVLLPGQSITAALSVPALQSNVFYVNATWIEESI